MKRRNFLKYSALAAGTLALGSTTNQWLWRSHAATATSQRLIVILLRGGVDGLNILVPYTDTDYYEARPRIAIAPPQKNNGALLLDEQFALHPSLTPLLPFWQNRSLSFIPACGSPDPTRSHFDAQHYMENGTPGEKKTRDGWLNRLLGQLENRNPVQAVNIGNTTPPILSGVHSVASLAPGKASSRPLAIDRPRISQAFNRLYQGKSRIAQVYEESRIARERLLADLAQEMEAANQGAPLPNGFVGDAKRLAKIMTKDPQVQLAFIALGGWDTHVNQGSHKGQLANRLKSLGQGLATLAQNLGTVYNHTLIVVLSEFGRTVVENGSGGTDHGHGNVMWLMGGSLQGGKVYGDWQGLTPLELYQGRDVPVLTDFRDPLISIFRDHFQLENSQIEQIFPDYRLRTRLSLV